jgi:hypothetical protein
MDLAGAGRSGMSLQGKGLDQRRVTPKAHEEATMGTTTEGNVRVELRQKLVDRFNESELRDLCFYLGIDYETLAGSNKPDKARELVGFCERHDRIADLIAEVKVLRPDISFEGHPKPPDKVPVTPGGPPGNNPYSNRRALRSPDCFCGRSYEVRTALSLLANAQSISVIGSRHIGKSSLLYHISTPSVLKSHFIDPEQFAFIFLSCEQLSDLDRGQILQVLFNQARAAMSRFGFQVDPGAAPTSSMTFFDYSAAFARLTQLGRKLVFLLDEFEYMAENSSLTPEFFAGLRSIAGNQDLAYVTATGRSLLDLTYADKSVLGSPFFNIFSTIRLGLFDDKDARELINRPSRGAGVEFSNATVDFILSLADHHPLFIQIACFHAFEMQAQNGALTAADYPLLSERVKSEVQDHLQYAWSKLKDQEKQALLSPETAWEDPQFAKVMTSLKNHGVICQSNSRYRLCALWADFVRSQATRTGELEPLTSKRQPPTIVWTDIERV